MKIDKLHLILFFVVHFWFGNFLSFSQSQPVFGKINQSSGLSNSRITSIVKEKNGFVWIGTNNGLNRYDGVGFKVYNRQNSNIGSNDISDLFIDSKENLWIATLGGGLYLYNQAEDLFEIFNNLESRTSTLISDQVNTVIEDSKGRLWFGTEKGLAFFNPISRKFSDFIQPFKSEIQNNYNITSIYEDKNGCLWVGTFGNGLFVFDPVKNNFEKITSESQKVSKFINAISELNPDNILVGTSGSGMLLFDLTTKTFSNFFKENLELKEDLKIILSIKKDKHNNLWVGTDGNGLFEIRYPNGKLPIINNYLYNAQLQSSLSGNAIYEIMDDEDSNIWIGTAWNGISILNPQKKSERIISDIAGINPSPILSVFENGSTLFLGLDGQGLTEYNYKTGNTNYYNESHKTPIGGKYIQHISKSSEGNLWIGTFANGLIKFDPKTGKYKQYKNRFDNSETLSYNDVRDVIKDDNHNLWIATWGGGLNYFNAKTEKFSSFRKGNEHTLNNDNLVALELDESKIWIATFGGGLNVFDINSKTTSHFLHTETDSTTISNNNIFSLLKDSKGFLWIGTSGGGINRMDLKTNEIERFEASENIKYLTITAIIEDDNQNIWFSSKEGILNYDYKSNEFNVFPDFSGEYHINSVFKDQKGVLSFGGIEGVLKFDPKTISKKNIRPEVKLTNFKLFNNKVKINENGILKKDIAIVDEIILEHNQDVITFEFSAMQFPFANNCEYAIKMENFDKQWRTIGLDRTATFTNLSPGNYIFKVKSKTIGSDWGKDYTSLNLNILKPFWLEWWAYLIYTLLLIVMFYLFRKNTIGWERMKSNLEFEKFSHEKDNELYNLKQQFFTNISHEIRTPVTLILSSINRLFDQGGVLEKKHTNAAHTIKKSGNNLLRLVNELLDIRKLESNELKLRITKNDFVPYCKEVFLSFSAIATDRNIEYNFETNGNDIELWFDKNQLEKVLYNILTNAFKFTKNNGRILFIIENNNEMVSVSIIDSGIGMTDFHLSKIFNRFYQEKTIENNDHSGFGLGLSISKEILNLHKGRIDVKSKTGVGSTFKIELLKGNSHFKGNDIIINDDFFTESKGLQPTKTEFSKKNDTERQIILIVEDNVEIQNYLKETLINNYDILQSFNGKEGLNVAQKSFPDLIISDVMMPIMDGIEFTKKIKLNTNTSHIPVIILTARTSPQDKMEGLETGADVYITKPFDEELLKIRISNLLKSRKLLRNKFRNEHILSPKELAINSVDQIFFKKLYTALDENLESNNLKAVDISKEIGMSHSVMYKKIKALTGLSYIEFIREYRLSIAKKLISELGYSVSETCFKVGYSDRKYFSKLFKQKFKRNPSDFFSNNK